MRRPLVLGGFAAIAVAFLAVSARHDIHALTFVVRASEIQGAVRRLADLDAVRTQEHLVNIPLGTGSTRGRLYGPVGIPRQTVLLVSGLHPAGIDEPRLTALSRRLAEAGVTVLTPEIIELSQFEVTPVVTDRIEEAALWLATQSGLVPSGQIGLMGISFSGGLAIVAAGRPSLRNHLMYVFSFGGHDNLGNVLEYLCDGREDGTTAAGLSAPHDYGVAIVLLQVADRVVPPEQAAALREAVRRFLWASHLDRIDKPRADREFAALRDLAHTLPEPAATLLRYVNDRDVAHLGRRLRPYIGILDQAALSPARSRAPSMPVYLLHGRDDNVIPARESQRLAERLGGGRVRVRLLVTDLISHAEADRPVHIVEVMKLARFWGDLLGR